MKDVWNMDKYLRATEITDWEHPKVLEIASLLSDGARDLEEKAKRCYRWVRDEIKHSYDYQLSPVTCSASEVISAGTGYCFAKSHLLVALLRANGIPAGFCYQRLSRDDNGPPYTLHGLVAICIPQYGWYRVDPRGNRPGIDARFTPPIERLAFHPSLAGEADLPEIWTDPLPVVVEALRSYKTWDALWKNLPDIELLTVNKKMEPDSNIIDQK
jgi:transglutaminase-like putative cysteine protease